jgi:predicted nucleotide-binding protein (sugar kinase/HSP70/actin superfamily)
MEAADSFRVLGPVFERRFWNGLVAVDLLVCKLLDVRPYETEPGRADAVYGEWVARVADAVGQRGFLDTVVAALDALDAVPTDRSEPRPCIGITGEHYIGNLPYANNGLVRQIEQLGGQAWPSPYFTDFLRVQA